MRRSPRSVCLMWTAIFVVVEALPGQPVTVIALSTVARSAMRAAVALVNESQVVGAGVVGAGAGAGVVAGGVEGAGTVAMKPVYSSLFGEPLPVLMFASTEPLFTSASRTSAGVAVGFLARYR